MRASERINAMLQADPIRRKIDWRKRQAYAWEREFRDKHSCGQQLGFENYTRKVLAACYYLDISPPRMVLEQNRKRAVCDYFRRTIKVGPNNTRLIDALHECAHLARPAKVMDSYHHDRWRDCFIDLLVHFGQMDEAALRESWRNHA